MKKALFVFFVVLLLAVNHLFANEIESDIYRSSNFKKAKEYELVIEQNRLAEKTNKAIDNIIKSTTGELKKRGYKALAETIASEYVSRYENFIFEFDARDVGDHPGIQWLLSVHSRVEGVLGEEICRAIRAHDLWTLAHTIPVVFKCVDSVNVSEYEKHFVPFLGICSYWISYGICMGASFGTGISFGCGFIGMGIEQIVIRFIAPKINQKAWMKACRIVHPIGRYGKP